METQRLADPGEPEVDDPARGETLMEQRVAFNCGVDHGKWLDTDELATTGFQIATNFGAKKADFVIMPVTQR